MLMRTSFIIVAAGLIGSSVQAQVCVDPLGTPPCHATIQDAVTAAAAGNTITIAPAIYAEAVTIPPGKNGLRLRGAGAKKTIIDAGPPVTGTALVIQSDDVSVEALGIRLADEDGIRVDTGVAGTRLVKISVERVELRCVNLDGPGTLIEKSVLSGCDDHAVDGSQLATNTIIRSNIISRSTGCVRLFGNGALVEKNKFQLCDDFDAVDIVADQFVVRKNKVDVSEDGIDVFCTPCTQALIAGNKITNAGGDSGGIRAETDAPGLVIEKNSVRNTTDSAVFVLGTGVVVRGNKVKSFGGDSGDFGFEFEGTDHTIEGNSATGGHQDGFYIGGDGHVVEGNKSVDNLGDGFEIDGIDITLTGNKAKGNRGEGFDIAGGSEQTTLLGNYASGNRVDFCDEGIATTSTDNDFDTTAAVCATD